MGDDDEEKKNFIIHTSFATKSSKFIRAALAGDWKEAREKLIPLPEARVADFQIYTEWMYTGRIANRAYDGSSDNSVTLVRLYILGEYLGDTRFSNTIMDNLLQISCSPQSPMVFGSDTVGMAWEHTLPGSPLRMALAQLIICHVCDCHYSAHFNDVGTWSKEVSAEVFKQIGTHARTSSYPLPYEGKCAFHKHDEEDPNC